MKLERLDHLVITTRDIEASLRFYVDILGMEFDGSGGRCAVRFGEQKLNLHREKAEFQPAARNVSYGSQDLCFITNEAIEAVRDELQEKGWPIELGIVARNGALGPMDSIYVRDPDGNLIEIAAYRKNE